MIFHAPLDGGYNLGKLPKWMLWTQMMELNMRKTHIVKTPKQIRTWWKRWADLHMIWLSLRHFKAHIYTYIMKVLTLNLHGVGSNKLIGFWNAWWEIINLILVCFLNQSWTDDFISRSLYLHSCKVETRRFSLGI